MKIIVWLCMACATFVAAGIFSSFNRDWTAACATFAAHRLGDDPPIVFEDLDHAKAIPACRKAVDRDPTAINQTRLARALLAKATQEGTAINPDTIGLLQAGIDAKYLPAYGISGYLFEKGIGNVEQNIPQALQFYDFVYARSKDASLKYHAGWLRVTSKLEVARGLKEIEEAGAEGAVYAFDWLGQYYIDQRPSLAMAYYKKGADLGETGYLMKAAKIPGLTPTQRVSLYNQAMSVGDTEVFTPYLNHLIAAGKDNTRHDQEIVRVAKEGVKHGHAFSHYLLGWSNWYGRGTPQDALAGINFLEKGIELGSPNAKEFYDKSVAKYARQLRNMPSGDPSRCVKRRVSQYDNVNYDFHNGCETPINTVACSNKLGTDIISFFTEKDSTTCRYKTVYPGGMIDNFYGARESSSLARKLISDTKLNIWACHVPLQPTGRNGNWFCEFMPR